MTKAAPKKTAQKTEPEETPEDEAGRAALVKSTAVLLGQGKVKLADIWAALTSPPVEGEKADRTPAKPKPLTDPERAALSRLPKVYGVVAPDTVRLLTDEEAVAIVEERETIDLILGLLEKRKSGSIREALANHLDLLLEQMGDAEELAGYPVDDKGHYQTRQDVPVPGTGKKIQKTASEPKPNLSSAGVQEAFADGAIDRKTYLSLTTMPEVERQLDEAKLTKAIKADPNLLWTLRGYTTVGKKITTIKVEND